MPKRFRKSKSINIPYEKQGYIYFLSRRYSLLSSDLQTQILNHCKKVAGEYWVALFEYVTTEEGAAAICLRNYIAEATLYRLVRKYHEEFPEIILHSEAQITTSDVLK